MGTPLASQTVSGYNASPPPDDGTVSAANKVTWAKIKTQLGDPLNSFDSSINSALRTALNVTPTSQSSAYTTTTADHLRPIEVTGTTTISLGDSATMVASSMGYQVPIINRGSSVVTVALITATDTLDGTTNGTVKLAPGNGAIFSVNSTSNGYETIARAKPYIHGADIASAATVNLDAATGDYVHVTGTTTITAITLQDGDEKTVEFTGALTLTNGASLVLPGAANITTAAGDTAIFRAEAAGLVRCIAYTKAAYAPSTSKQPTRTVLTTGSGTYTTPTNATRIDVQLIGGGGGGAAATTNNGTAGGNTTFGVSLTAGGGGLGNTAGGAGGAGGTATGGDINIPGGAGGAGIANTGGSTVALLGGHGGNGFLGGGAGSAAANAAGGAGATNSGGGGAGGGNNGATTSGGGGGAGGYVRKLLITPAATYTYAVGTAGSGGIAGVFAGGNGAVGIIIVDEYYD